MGGSMDSVFDPTVSLPSPKSDENNDPKMLVVNLPRHAPMTLEFRDLTYSLKGQKWWFQRNPFSRRKMMDKPILREISGIFKPGQLTAIMGPSGCGKTTLMNILAGYKNPDPPGVILVNGEPRELFRFRKKCAYILQDDVHLSQLTVMEAMRFAAQLKLPLNMSRARNECVVNEILADIGLTHCKNTRISKISHGESKLLSMALELVGNPPILILDEPLTGLDSSSCYSCVRMLKRLAGGGRTIVVTVHQPTARIFEQFDALYLMAEGQNLYKGPTEGLVPFLAAQGLPCPADYNPAVFAIELAGGDYGEQCIQLLASATCMLGEDDETAICSTSEQLLKGSQPQIHGQGHDTLSHNLNKVGHSPTSSADTSSTLHKIVRGWTKQNGAASEGGTIKFLQSEWPVANSTGDLETGQNKSEKEKEEAGEGQWWRDFYHFEVLFRRSFLCAYRNVSFTHQRFLQTLFMALLMGSLFRGVGNDASGCHSNFGNFFCAIFFQLMTAMMSTVVTFPLERKVYMREKLNGWYSLKSYFFAKTTADLPFQLFFPFLYILIVYHMTDQPQEAFRFWMTYGLTALVSILGQSLGLFLGSIFSVEEAVFVAPVSTFPAMLFSGYFATLDSLPNYLRWMTWISYTRYAIQATLTVLYGFDREPLTCSTFFCEYKDPKKFLQSVATLNVNVGVQIAYIFGFILTLRFCTYWILWVRVALAGI